MKIRILLIVLLLSSFNSFSQTTYVPDDNFEQALIDLGYDNVLDDYVLTSNINEITSLLVDNLSINDLTGIEDFTSINFLGCNDNNITNLDVSNNKELISLNCYFNPLTSLNVSGATELENLFCYGHELTNLDVSNNLKLKKLNLNGGQLGTIDVSKNTELTFLSCNNSQLTTLDVSNNLSLTSLYCGWNQLTSLDVSNNSLLSILFCRDNNLTNLNVENGNNTNFTFFEAYNNPNLTCIQVDNPIWSRTNWLDIDTQSFFSENCFTLPFNNFAIDVISETCPEKNNGQISILASENYNYETTINDVIYNFTDELLVADLPPDIYNVCVSVTGESYEQCFSIEILEGTTISGKASIVSKKASIEITQGTAPYDVWVNGRVVLKTLSKSFTVDVVQGDLVEVKTDVDCEGIFSKTIESFETITAYPNPTKGAFKIALPIPDKEVFIEFYTIESQLISRGTYPIVYGKVQLSLENKPTGTYILKIHMEKPADIKIIKH